MTKPVSVIDDHANVEETLQSMARVLGTDKVRRNVFSVLNGRHRRPLDIEMIMEIGGIPKEKKQQVRNALNLLSSHKIILKAQSDPTRRSTLDHYERSPWLTAARKRRLLSLADDKAKRESLPTKRNRVVALERSASATKIIYRNVRIDVLELTLDDLESFRDVRTVEPRTAFLRGLSENAFKKGVQAIIGENALFKDWGGEKSDLLSTRVIYNGRRIGTAFAFKGPGQAGALTPARMGKNGYQALRLFERVADLYVVQHWREIAPSVRVLIHTLAVAHSVMRNSKIYYCLIDGSDSQRIVDAYSSFFPATNS